MKGKKKLFVSLVVSQIVTFITFIIFYYFFNMKGLVVTLIMMSSGVLTMMISLGLFNKRINT